MLQVYEVPFAAIPVAPAGEQNAPGLTAATVAPCVGDGVGVALALGELETVGAGEG